MAQASILTDSECKRVLRVIALSRNASRNRAAFSLSLYGGLRVGEIAAMLWSDVASSTWEIRREVKLAAYQTKGSYGRTVVLSKRLQAELELFRTLSRPNDLRASLIKSQRGGSFSPGTLSMLFRDIYDRAGVKTSSHSGRRTFASRLNAKGVGMRTIQKLMGHKHISTTALYCDVSDDLLRNAVELV